MEGSDSSASDDFSDTIFWFLDENCRSSENFSGGSSEEMQFAIDEEEEEEEGSVKAEENRAFWDSQDQLLQATLCRTSSTESRIRQATKEALVASELVCSCRRSATSGGCRSCLRKEVSNRLCNSGFDCSVRKSKWKSSSDIPSGEHTYLEVVEKKKGGEAVVRVIVELHFRAEFEMARAGEEYERLVRRLPEVFVGKAERLRSLVKIMCGAAKRCMKDKKMHIGPWRKHKYMLAKWLSGHQVIVAAPDPEPEVAVAVGNPGGRAGRPRASMLTFALVERPHCRAVAVV